MYRDFKFSNRSSGKLEEVENVDPLNSHTVQSCVESSRPPLNTIQDQDTISQSKLERTPSKKGRGYEPSMMLPLRTPDKHGGKHRFGWAQRNDTVSNLYDDKRGSGVGNGSLVTVTTPRVIRTVGRGVGSATTACSESNSTQSTPTKSVTKPPCSSIRSKVDGNNFNARLGNYAPALYKGGMFTPTVANTVRVPHFDLKEDSSFWINHNTQVIIRVRPLNSMERSTQGYNRCLKQESAQCITWIGQPETRFTFDHVACETVDQEMIFRMAGLPMVENCLSGYNSCMFAYGQTGSGKTYTMLGEIEDLDVKPSPHRGMTPRIFEFLFARIQAEEDSRRDENLKYNCKCSFLEIYNEQITDLLDPSSTNLLLREDVKKGVYVENLSEFEVQSVSDIIGLLIQGSANRKVAATNMNRESSRSHSVFTCVIESTWEKDSTTNYRFARLNLVDLAGSERQKTSGAEGERLKEAASINKSLSTLGHVIMILVDVANGRQRHVPYRDSRLTFLLQDSLGGNSKTMIIANVSPSICCNAETLNTLKFAQRAKLIQNNAVVNEDSTGDVIALQNQIRLLKEELSSLKCRDNVSRSLFLPMASAMDIKQSMEDSWLENEAEMVEQHDDDLLDYESKGIRMSHKQIKSLETTLAGALRREQMAESSIKKLVAEIEQLDRLVRQREEDTRSCKMMLRFRDDKIRRLESQLAGSIPTDIVLLEDNKALSDEIQILQGKLEQNPEVTRFALENIRLQDQLRRYEEFYEEGERDILLAEVSSLRKQLLQFQGRNSEHGNSNYGIQPQNAKRCSKETDSVDLELKNTLNELHECRRNLNSCLEENAKLNTELESFRSMLSSMNVQKDSITEPSHEAQTLPPKMLGKHEPQMLNQTEDTLNLQLELDIIKIILKEERTFRGLLEEQTTCINRDFEMANDKLFLTSKQLEDAQYDLKEAKSVIDALESQQILSIKEIEELRNKKSHYLELMRKQEREIMGLKNQLAFKELRYNLPSNHSGIENEYPLQVKLRRMHDSLEKAKKLNMVYQSDHAFHVSNEEEMDEVRRQAEAETAEVIVCMQEELAMLQNQVHDSNLKEIEMKESILHLETELNKVQEKLLTATDNNQSLSEEIGQKNMELRSLAEEWELLTTEIEEILVDGCETLVDASDELGYISNSLPQKRIWISEQVGTVVRKISEKELLIDELRRCLEDASNKRSDMECMLKSLRSASLVITEAHQKECTEKEKEILLLTLQLSEKTSTVTQLEEQLKKAEDDIRKASICATVAFVVVDRFSEVNHVYLDDLKCKDILLSELSETNHTKDALLTDQSTSLVQAERQIAELQERCDNLDEKLSDERKQSYALEQMLEDIEQNAISKTREQLASLQHGVSTIRSCMASAAEHSESLDNRNSLDECTTYYDNDGVARKSFETNQNNVLEPHPVEEPIVDLADLPSKLDKKDPKSKRLFHDACERDFTITLLKKEIECALESLKEVQDEMTRLRDEKKEMSMSVTKSQESIQCLTTQILALQAAMSHFEEQSHVKIEILSQKFRYLEKTLKEAGSHWYKTKESLELEVGQAKIISTQKAEEASCILAKFEDAQDMMKEADIMINGLMIANESMKLDIKGFKKREAALLNEKGILISQVESLQAVIDLKHEEIENIVQSNLLETKALVVELDDVIKEVQLIMKENSMPFACELQCIKSHYLQSTKLVQPWLEEIWSEIFLKDCAMSVLHLCHMGILLETVTGMHAENGLLSHGLSESSSVINDLKEHNFRTRQELDMYRILKGKLLNDIKSGFDRITRKEVEAGEITVKLNTFARNISNLQLQEEMMLQRSNEMGSQLATLMRELNLSNANVVTTLLDQEKILEQKVVAIESQAEFFMADWYAKDFESIILASESKNMACSVADMEEHFVKYLTLIETLKKEILFFQVESQLTEQILMDKEDEVCLLRKEVQQEKMEKQTLLMELNQNILRIAEMGEINQVLEQNIESLKNVTCSNNALKSELVEVKEAENRLLDKILHLEADYDKVIRDIIEKDVASEFYFHQTLDLEHQNKVLENQNKVLEQNVEFLKDVTCSNNALKDELVQVQEAKNRLMDKIHYLEVGYDEVVGDLIEKDVVSEFSFHQISVLKHQNKVLAKNTEFLKDVTCSNIAMKGELVEVMEAKNRLLDKILYLEADYDEAIGDLIERDVASEFSFHQTSVLEHQNTELKKVNYMLVNSSYKLQNEVNLLDSELTRIQSLQQVELSRKDDVITGLLYDLSLLQESASNTKDQKDEIDEMVATMEALEEELAIKSDELADVAAKCQLFEAQVLEKSNIIAALEVDLSKECEALNLQVGENQELRSHIEAVLAAKKLVEDELTESRKITESLEDEILEMNSVLSQMNDSIKSLSSDLDELSIERDKLQCQVVCLEERLKHAEAQAEANEAIVHDAQKMAERRKLYAEDKEAEVKLLERSVEELESTINVLENKVDIIKGEAERQRLEREDLELELHAIKDQMQNVTNADADMRRFMDEKEKNLEETLNHIQVLKRVVAGKDAEIEQLKAHISELNLHAEAQAKEYQQKFKALEAMIEQVKPEGLSTQSTCVLSNSSDKNATKSRGSGSPFKCIGLGLAQQIKYEKIEELSAASLRIGELESQAVCQQKEIFSLKAKLAGADSMTHDVIRELLGVKLDMTSYKSLLDNQQVQEIVEKAQFLTIEPQEKEQDVIKLKNQLNEFIEERKGWLEEMDRKQAEMLATQIALENLRHREQLLKTENGMLQMEHVSMKNKVTELEEEVKKLSGQQNLQQRIHHHAKIKEENNRLKIQNEELSTKLRRADIFLSRVKEDLARLRASAGVKPRIDFDEEQRLMIKLKEMEGEKVQLAQQLLRLTTNVLKVAGIVKPMSDINPSLAEEALEMLNNRITSLEMEQQDLKFKNKIINERIRLSEILPQTSPSNSRP
ncbi:putative plus-end-directed kinesin ATPase transcription factor bZIP family [Lupinus albus]|uniref:Putative plus-end-directed kinesin ATPase transcription factor bZIP family n=1 Tax=Lupinus albus TaxID=3870 RepID=A0A6A4Q0B6_LUPAL|nr:putative plus-end-directed kinesin ATPase transcription factor bZIP family [Lupinus albus]